MEKEAEMKIRRLGEYELTWRWDEPPQEFRSVIWAEIERAVAQKDVGLLEELCALLKLVDCYYMWKDRDHSFSETYENGYGHATEGDDEFMVVIEDPVTWEIQRWLRGQEEAQR